MISKDLWSGGTIVVRQDRYSLVRCGCKNSKRSMVEQSGLPRHLRSPAVSVLLREGRDGNVTRESRTICVVFPRHRYGLEAVVGMIAARLLDGGGGY
jgi:hypothetical protein